MAEDFEINESLPEEGTNRTFVIAAAGIGGLLVLSMICMALYVLVLAPRQSEARIARQTEIALENTQVAQQLTETVQAGQATDTPDPTETATPINTSTPTQVVVLPTETSTPTPFTSLATAAPLTQTAAALQTQQADVPTATETPTALPSAGFADEVGLPGLALFGAALVVVVILSRRLRAVTTR